MQRASPKFVPREWMLVRAYEAADAGDFGPVRELATLFARPYDDEPPGVERACERFYRLTPEEDRDRPGVSFYS
jgi:uncharacterized protein YdiU (UPF0061 family)